MAKKATQVFNSTDAIAPVEQIVQIASHRAHQNFSLIMDQLALVAQNLGRGSIIVSNDTDKSENDRMVTKIGLSVRLKDDEAKSVVSRGASLLAPNGVRQHVTLDLPENDKNRYLARRDADVSEAQEAIAECGYAPVKVSL